MSDINSADLRQLGTLIGKLVASKNEAYGNSFGTAGEALRLLYPKGIQTEQYDDMLALVRIWDKMKRIATHKDAFGESPFVDIAGYSLLGAVLSAIKEGEAAAVAEMLGKLSFASTGKDEMDRDMETSARPRRRKTS
jgi:hypothetical protein